MKVNIDTYRGDNNLYPTLKNFRRKSESILSLFREEIEEIKSFQFLKLTPGYIGNLYCEHDPTRKISEISNIEIEDKTYIKISEISNIEIEDRTYIITVHDKHQVDLIIKVIKQQRSLPVVLGDEKNVLVVRLPDVTEERRQQMITELKQLIERTKIKVRLIRQDSLSDLKKIKKDEKITDDELKVGIKAIESMAYELIYEIEILSSRQETDLKKGAK